MLPFSQSVHLNSPVLHLADSLHTVQQTATGTEYLSRMVHDELTIQDLVKVNVPPPMGPHRNLYRKVDAPQETIDHANDKLQNLLSDLYCKRIEKYDREIEDLEQLLQAKRRHRAMELHHIKMAKEFSQQTLSVQFIAKATNYFELCQLAHEHHTDEIREMVCCIVASLSCL